MNGFEHEISDYLIKKHRYFGVEFDLVFTSKDFKKNFLKVMRYAPPEEKKHLHIGFTYELQYSIMSRHQRYYLLYKRHKNETGYQFKERKYGYLYKTNYFLKEMRLNDRRGGLLITCYIKPSGAITRLLKGIKTNINNWYYSFKLIGFNHPDHTNKPFKKRESRDVIKDRILEDSSKVFKIFNLNA